MSKLPSLFRPSVRVRRKAKQNRIEKRNWRRTKNAVAELFCHQAVSLKKTLVSSSKCWRTTKNWMSSRNNSSMALSRSPGRRKRVTTSSPRPRYGRRDDRGLWSVVSSYLMIVSTVAKLLIMICAMVVRPSMKAGQGDNKREPIKWLT